MPEAIRSSCYVRGSAPKSGRLPHPPPPPPTPCMHSHIFAFILAWVVFSWILYEETQTQTQTNQKNRRSHAKIYNSTKTPTTERPSEKHNSVSRTFKENLTQRHCRMADDNMTSNSTLRANIAILSTVISLKPEQLTTANLALYNQDAGSFLQSQWSQQAAQAAANSLKESEFEIGVLMK
jgi:hypothetical protein